MRRLASTVLVLALLGGTAAAFAVTQSLKLERAPVTRPKIERAFSPRALPGATRAADIRFYLRSRDLVTIEILDEADEVVRRLADARSFPAGRVELSWDGRDDAGQVVRDGEYRLRVHLAEADRTLLIPGKIRVDATRPVIAVLAVSRTVFSPDGDGRGDAVTVRYRLSERGRAMLLVDGRRRTVGQIRGRRRGLIAPLHWFGRSAGRGLPARTYQLSLAAEDVVGNVSAPTRPISVRIRYIELPRRVIHTRAGSPFTVRVSTDARPYRWRLGVRRGLARRARLALRAPRRGRYVLSVEANGRAAHARVLVGPRR